MVLLHTVDRGIFLKWNPDFSTLLLKDFQGIWNCWYDQHPCPLCDPVALFNFPCVNACTHTHTHTHTSPMMLPIEYDVYIFHNSHKLSICLACHSPLCVPSIPRYHKVMLLLQGSIQRFSFMRSLAWFLRPRALYPVYYLPLHCMSTFANRPFSYILLKMIVILVLNMILFNPHLVGTITISTL